MPHTSPRALAVLSLVVAAGCPGPRPRPQPAVEPASCAARYPDIEVGAACSDTEASCADAQGRCWCGPRSYCGGVAPPDGMLEQLARPTWQCEPARTDGCPEVMPTGTCEGEGRACDYGDCCFQTSTCTGGRWVADAPKCPP